MGNRKLLIVEDHDVLRKSMTKWLQNIYPEFQFFKVSSGEEALELSEYTSFNILIVDINLPGINGFEVIKNVMEKYPETKIIVLTMYDGEEYEKEALLAGARVFINKKDLYVEVPNAINLFIKEINQV